MQKLAEKNYSGSDLINIPSLLFHEGRQVLLVETKKYYCTDTTISSWQIKSRSSVKKDKDKQRKDKLQQSTID